MRSRHRSRPSMPSRARPDDTDWNRIVDLYDLLVVAVPSPVVDLNRAVAVSMRDGPEAGLESSTPCSIEGIWPRTTSRHAARADLLRRLGRFDEARDAYALAIALSSRSRSAGSSNGGWTRRG